jgi:hypothetical protein
MKYKILEIPEGNLNFPERKNSQKRFRKPPLLKIFSSFFLLGTKGVNLTFINPCFFSCQCRRMILVNLEENKWFILHMLHYVYY